MSEISKIEKPLLSICIPTYNRDTYLEKTINSIIGSKEFLEKKVEIVVSDNLSTDNTEKICNAFKKNFDNFYYYRNEKNIQDENFPKVLSLAHGSYRKLSNDSHIYLKDSLNKMCKIVEEYKDRKPYIYWAIAKFTTTAKTKKKESLSFEKFLLTAGEHITNILSFGLWEEDRAILSDTGACKMKLWQADATLKLASKSKNIIIYNDILVSEQMVQNKDVSYDVFKVFHDNYLSIVGKYTKDKNILLELEKNMLFDTFFHWRLKWDDDKSIIKFDKEKENLPKQIEKVYEKRLYYVLYLVKINLAKTCRKIKRFLAVKY